MTPIGIGARLVECPVSAARVGSAPGGALGHSGDISFEVKEGSALVCHIVRDFTAIIVVVVAISTLCISRYRLLCVNLVFYLPQQVTPPGIGARLVECPVSAARVSSAQGGALGHSGDISNQVNEGSALVSHIVRDFTAIIVVAVSKGDKGKENY